jgi:hypothetical protein
MRTTGQRPDRGGKCINYLEIPVLADGMQLIFATSFLLIAASI